MRYLVLVYDPVNKRWFVGYLAEFFNEARQALDLIQRVYEPIGFECYIYELTEV